MRIFLAALVLIFSFQSLTKADDIRDFEIEGISVGDSILSFLDKKYFNDNKEYFSSPKKGVKKEYSWIFLDETKITNYDAVRIYFKSLDSKNLVQNISGYKYFQNDPAGCKSFKNNVASEVSQIAKDYTKEEYPYYELKGTEGTRDMIVFTFKDSSTIKLICYDYKLDKYYDRFTLSLSSSDFQDFQNNRSHK